MLSAYACECGLWFAASFGGARWRGKVREIAAHKSQRKQRCVFRLLPIGRFQEGSAWGTLMVGSCWYVDV